MLTRRRRRGIELDDLVAVAPAGVGHVKRHGQRSAGRGPHVEVGVVELRVAQAVAERVERLAPEIPVGAAGHRVVLEVGQVGRGAIEGHGQPAGRVVVAEQDIGDGGAARLAGIPRLQDGARMSVRPGQSDRAAGEVDENDGHAGRLQLLEQLLLQGRKLDAGAIAAREALVIHAHLLALELRRDAADKHDHVGRLRGGDRLGHARVRRRGGPVDRDVQRTVALRVFQRDRQRDIVRQVLHDAHLALLARFAGRRRPRVDDGFAADLQAEAAAAADDQPVVARERRLEGALPAGGDAVVRHVVGPAAEEVIRIAPVEAEGALGPLGDGLAGEVGVGEIFAVDPAGVDEPAFGRADRVIAAVGVVDLHAGRLERGLQAGEDGDGGGRRTVVVAEQHRHGRGVGADDDDVVQLFLPQRQQAVVLEQHQRFARGAEGQRAVFGRVVLGRRNPVEGHTILRIEKSEAEHRAQQRAEPVVELGLGDEAALDRLDEGGGLGAAPDVHARPQGQGVDLGEIAALVGAAEIVDRAAVGGDVAVETPFRQQRVEQRTHRGRRAVDRVVGRHHGLDVPFAHERLEGRQISLIQVGVRRGRVEIVAQRLGTAVHGVVFGARRGEQVVGVVALQAVHERHAEAGGEERVLAVGLLAAAPARIAEDIDVGRPKGEAVEDRALLRRAGVAVELGAALDADDVRDVVVQRRVPHRSQADGLREDGRDTGVGDAVQRLAPPVVFRDAEARHAGGGVAHHAGLLLERHPGGEIMDARLLRLGRVEVGRRGFHCGQQGARA